MRSDDLRQLAAGFKEGGSGDGGCPLCGGTLTAETASPVIQCSPDGGCGAQFRHEEPLLRAVRRRLRAL